MLRAYKMVCLSFKVLCDFMEYVCMCKIGQERSCGRIAIEWFKKIIFLLAEMRNYSKLHTSNESFIIVKRIKWSKLYYQHHLMWWMEKYSMQKSMFPKLYQQTSEKFLVCAYIKFNIAQSSSHGVVSFVVCDFSWWKRCCIEENMINILVVKGSAQHYWHRSFFLPKKPLSIIFEFPWFIN